MRLVEFAVKSSDKNLMRTKVFRQKSNADKMKNVYQTLRMIEKAVGHQKKSWKRGMQKRVSREKVRNE